MRSRIVLPILFLSLFGLLSTGCKTTGDDNAELSSTHNLSGKDLSGKDFCRMVGSINGAGQISVCLSFKDANSGVNSSNTAAGSPPERFRYTVSGNSVTTFTPVGRGPERQEVYTLSADGQSIAAEGFTWKLKGTDASNP
jgi:hypothetical protein